MSQQVTIWLKDEVNCTIVGLNSNDAKTLFDKFGIYVTGYMHRPQYKLGVWDGKKRFFSKLGNTYVNLLEQLVPMLVKMGYKLKIKDDRIPLNIPELSTDGNPFPTYVDSQTCERFQLRPYQIEAVNAVVADNGGIMIAGTGSGKTSMSATIASLYETVGFRTIIIVPTTTLVKQSADDMKMWGMDVGQYDGKTKQLDRKHLVSTWQSLQNVPTIMSDYDVVIVDECQAAQASVLANLLEKHGRHIRCRFGLTGTMPKDPVADLQIKMMLGNIKYEIHAHQLIEMGFLSDLDIEMIQLEEDIPDTHFPDYASENSYIRINKDRNGWLINFVRALSQQELGNTMVIVSSKQHGKKLASLMPEAHFVSGDDDVEDRAVIYDYFSKNNNLIVIVTAQVGGVGLSINRIFNLILLDIGKSFIRVIQAVGRGLRKNAKQGKVRVKVYDIHSSLQYGKKHCRDRIKFYKESKYPYSRKSIKYKENC